jgi:hypothetical protein
MAVRNGASSIHARSFFSIFLSRYSVAIIFCRWSFPINLDKKIPRNKISLPIFGWVKWGGYFFSQLERLKKYCSQFGAKQMSGRLGFQTRRARTLRQLRCGNCITAIVAIVKHVSATSRWFGWSAAVLNTSRSNAGNAISHADLSAS